MNEEHEGEHSTAAPPPPLISNASAFTPFGGGGGLSAVHMGTPDRGQPPAQLYESMTFDLKFVSWFSLENVEKALWS